MIAHVSWRAGFFICSEKKSAISFLDELVEFFFEFLKITV